MVKHSGNKLKQWQTKTFMKRVKKNQNILIIKKYRILK